jgi:hypothetical protein
MFLPDIALTDGTADQTFSLVTQRASSSLRSDPLRDVTTPRFLTIAHEKQTNGKVNSVVYIDSNFAVPSGTVGYEVYDTIRLQLKLSRNPLSGRSDLATEPAVLRAMLVDFINDAALWAKFLNQES